MTRCFAQFGLLAAFFLCSCSVLIEPGQDRCSRDEGCDDGEICGLDGLCVAEPTCVPGGIEVCNRRDDDCDGVIDESLEAPEICNGLDDDCDRIIDEEVGSTPVACNGIDEDCDMDFDEGSAEICDNGDNDCDGRTDEDTCPMAGEVCYFRTASCQPQNCQTDPTNRGCRADEFCDVTRQAPICLPRESSCERDSECGRGQVCYVNQGLCVDETPFGTACAFDVSCADGTFCAPLVNVGESGLTCTRTCCNDDDCPEGICASSGTGARLCVRSSTRATIDASCDRNSACTSGYCDPVSLTCQSQCARNEDCDAGTLCVHGSGRARGCRAAPGRAERYGDCTSSTQCQSGLCVFPSPMRGVCLEGCNHESDCGSDEGCFSFRLGTPSATFYHNLCFFLDVPPELPSGSSCTEDTHCQSNYCHDNECVAPCCADRDCGSNSFCRPIPRNGHFPTYCIPPL